jgi:hypothetical protein
MTNLDSTTVTRGYAGLLNLGAERHHTVFVVDFELPDETRARLREHLAPLPTKVHFLSLGENPGALLAEAERAGVDLGRDYVSVHTLSSGHSGFDASQAFFRRIRRGDFTRLELPCREMGFEPGQANTLLGVVERADYIEQDTLSDVFFSMLEGRSPYRVEVETPGSLLVIEDSRPWFQLGGRLREGEVRILPGGEVAYTGDGVHGTLTVDGALLATPTRPAAAPRATELGALSARLAEEPVQLDIQGGRLVGIRSQGALGETLWRLFDHEAYRKLTEVGVSFNRACAQFVHDWPAASNEGRPGVHIAVGGDPEADGVREGLQQPVVHVDLMAARTLVRINGEVFLRTA